MINRTFQRRYLFSGQIVLKTGLHIGGGEGSLSASDSPVVRTADDQPYIPGSSLKGSFRSMVEKLAVTLGRNSCGLIEGQGCPGAPGKDREQKLFNNARREQNWDEDTTLGHLNQGITLEGQRIQLCETCWLFGSSYAASKISFNDLYLTEEIEGIVQMRDGVAIDRDSEKAVDTLLYNYEVVAPTLAFGMEILLEDPTEIDLRLTCLGLSEFMSGFGGLGGKRSRGLGRCLLEKLRIYELDLTIADTDERARRLRRYLLGKTPADKMTPIDNAPGFIETQLEALLA